MLLLTKHLRRAKSPEYDVLVNVVENWSFGKGLAAHS
jgi:hypothetical protein